MRFFLFNLLVFLCKVQVGCAYGSESLFAKFPNTYFIESGSFTGNGIQQALNTGCFAKIHSIELSRVYYQTVLQRFENHPQVFLWQGDSGELLNTLLQDIEASATFWLDAHYSGGDTAHGSTESPILKELRCIRNHAIKTHVILIDDVRQFGSYEFDYVTLEEIVHELLQINPNYTIEFLDCPFKEKDVLAAYEAY